MNKQTNKNKIKKVIKIILTAVLVVLLISPLALRICTKFSSSSFEGLNMAEEAKLEFVDRTNGLALRFADNDKYRLILTDNNSGEEYGVKTIRGGIFGNIFTRVFDMETDKMLGFGTMLVSKDGKEIKVKYDSWKYYSSNFIAIEQ